MKRTLFLYLAGALTLAAQPGMGWWHETRATGWFGAGGSAAINPIATQLNNAGWNISGGGGVTGQYFGLMLDATFNEFGFNRRTLYRVGADDGHQRFWGFTLDPIVHVNQRGPVDFYITGGGGIYGDQISFNQQFFVGGYGRGYYFRNTIYKPGVNGGVGFAYSIGGSRVKVFAEARFHHVFIDNGAGASFIPVTVGVSF